MVTSTCHLHSTAEMWGSVMISLLLKFALSANWLPNRYSMQWEGEVESVLAEVFRG